MKLSVKLLSAAALLSISLVACKKSDNTQTQTDNDDKDNVQTVAVTDQIGTEMDEAFDEGLQCYTNGATVPINGIVLGPCVTVTFTQTGNLKTLTIDFGPQGCLCFDGKVRKGKLIATATNFNQVNVLRTLTTENYYVNDYHVQGTITRNITRDISATTRQADIAETLSITTPNNQHTWSRSATLTRIFYYGTVGYGADNTLTTWGQVNVNRANGNQITRTVSENTPLLYKNSCHQIVSGIANIVTNNHNFTIDFGTGACDDQATVSNGTSTWIINL